MEESIIIYIIPTIIIIAGIIAYASYFNFNKYLAEFTNTDCKHHSLEEKIKEELARIEILKKNRKEIQQNTKELDIPSPEELTKTDDIKSTLNKLSVFYEKHNIKVSGLENFALSILPISQTGTSLQALCHTLPDNLGEKIFAEAWTDLKNGIHPDSISDFITKFFSGMSDLSHATRRTMMTAFNHHEYFKGIITPIEHGAMEALGINDCITDISSSLHEIGADLSSAAESCTEIAELTDIADIDITGHLPVITITMSAVREIQLLVDNKTNILSAFGHIALDTIGTGGGGFIGTIIGVCIGALTQSTTGILIGAIGGGVLGGVFGRKFTNWIKTRPYRKAIEEYTEKYNLMVEEKKKTTESTFVNIKTYADNKRTEFKNLELFEKMPIYETDEIISKITLIIYQTIIKELYSMKEKMHKLKHSIWFSSKKHSNIINNYEKKIDSIKSHLPSPKEITTNPHKTLNIILGINLPNSKCERNLTNITTKCYLELKEMNDKNDSSILLWAHIVENHYRNALNEVATYSNSQMKELNEVFNRWDVTIKRLEEKVLKEKRKLGL